MQKFSILFWSASLRDVNGQALVTKEVFSFLVRRKAQIFCCFYASGLRGIFFSWPFSFLRLWFLLIAKKFDVFYLVCSRSGFGFVRDIPALLASLFGVRTVVHVHGSDLVGLLCGRWYSALARCLYQRCTIILPSQHLLDDLVARGLNYRWVVCENFVKFSDGSNYVAEDSLKKSPFVLFWNSNILAAKGFYILAEAIEQLVQKGYGIELIAIGKVLGDQEMSQVKGEKILSALSRHKWFRYLGPVSIDESIRLLADSHAVALPSRGECQPLAIIQAMCAGKKLLVSDIPALRATVGDYPAVWVRGIGLEDLKSALLQLIEDIAPIGSEHIRIAQGRFSIQRFHRQLDDILLRSA